MLTEKIFADWLSRVCFLNRERSNLRALRQCRLKAGQADEPEPPVWPARFHAVMSQNRSRDLGVVDLW